MKTIKVKGNNTLRALSWIKFSLAQRLSRSLSLCPLRLKYSVRCFSFQTWYALSSVIGSLNDPSAQCIFTW